MLKILGYVIAGIALWAVLMLLIGALLPKAHTATVRFTLKQAPDRVYDAIVDVGNGPKWRTGLESVTITSREPLQWQEKLERFGTMSFVMDEAKPPARVVTRIADTSQGFGGGWTYEITPAAAGNSVVSITENGEVYNPLFRFMSRFVFGHYASLETYAKDLGKHFGETVTTERVP
jgi:uncharacterized protein YndB with AHSA1/START domain